MLHMPHVEHPQEDTYELHELRILLQRWFSRISEESALRMHRETMRFIEADYSYEPLPPDELAPSGLVKQYRKMDSQIKSLQHVLDGSLFSQDEDASTRTRRSWLFRRPTTPAHRESPAALVPTMLAGPSSMTVLDPDERLSMARGEVTRLEKQLGDVVSACTSVAKARQDVDRAMEHVARKLPALAMLEETRPASMQGRLPHTLKSAHSMMNHVAQLSDQMVRYTDNANSREWIEHID